MKKIIIISIILLAVVMTAVLISSCASAKINSKSGNELWSENCGRCHLAPGKSTYTPKEWQAIGLHMRMRAQLTEQDTDKIIAFLKGED